MYEKSLVFNTLQLNINSNIILSESEKNSKMNQYLSKIPKLKLSNGFLIPALGLGTFKVCTFLFLL